jgi:hypothetical protein
MEDIEPRFTVTDAFRYLVAYACWLIAALVAMVTLLVMRNTLNVIWPILGGSRWVLRPIDRFGLVFLGLVWLVYVIFIEQHYRSSITLARTRRHKRRTNIDGRTEEMPDGRIMRFFRRLGLDILVQRFVPTVAGPLVLLALTYLLQQGVFTLLGR